MNTSTFLTVDWLEDSSGVVGPHGDYNHYLAQQKLKRKQEQEFTITKSEDHPIDNATSPTTETLVKPLALFPREPSVKPKEATFTALQEWEGYVIEVGEESFTARLIDLTSNDKYEEEEADFPIAELSESDQQMLRPGAIFRWAIGYRKTRGGTKERISRIIMRRLPAWTARELRENRRKAEDLAAALRGE